LSTDQSAEISRLAIIAMFSDDDLMEVLVLKGGNALDIAYGQAGRASYDIDFSMAKEFRPEELASVSAKIENALRSTFHERGYEVFDMAFAERPKVIRTALKDFWGGYQVEFKAIKANEHAELAGDIEAMRRQAAVVGPRDTRKLKIDISKFECCDLKRACDVDGFTVYVYAPELFVIEKLRAICQQMPEYGPLIGISKASARARDFFDIYTALEHFDVDLGTPENAALLKAVFDAKRVPLQLLGRIGDYREYHRPDFVSVEATVKPSTELKSFDFYFDYVLRLCEGLQPLWDV